MSVHQPVVAGTFYPADPNALGQAVHGLLQGAPKLGVPQPKALILPHAGYRFSGAVAAAGAVNLSAGEGIRRVVILGPSHHVRFQGLALPDADAMATPLGTVPIDPVAVEQLLKTPDVNVVPEAFAREHAIEVELPFLQVRLGAFAVVPLVVGEIAPDRLAAILDALWGGDETLIVISTDLTHFLTGAEAAKIDLATAQAIETHRAEGLSGREACGHRPLTAFLHCAAKRGLRLTRLALTHSGKVTGDEARVVGYGAWMAHDPEVAQLSLAHKREAFRVAARALVSRARSGKVPAIDLTTFPAPLQSVAHSFITLTLEGRLRGCIGSLKAHQPLAKDVMENAIKAGFSDPRFRPVTEDEILSSEIEIAVLSHPAPMTFASEEDLRGQLRPGRDGLILASGAKRGTFLPKVWDSLETPEKFLNGLKVKAGLPGDHWSDDMQVLRYVTETFRGRIGKT